MSEKEIKKTELENIENVNELDDEELIDVVGGFDVKSGSLMPSEDAAGDIICISGC